MNDRSSKRAGALPSWAAAELFFTAGVAGAIIFAVLSGTVSKSLGINQAQLGQLSGVYTLAYSVGQLILGILLTSRKHQGPSWHRLRTRCGGMFAKAGVALKADLEAAWKDFIGAHMLYEEEIAWLAAELGDPIPFWTCAPGRPEKCRSAE